MIINTSFTTLFIILGIIFDYNSGEKRLEKNKNKKEIYAQRENIAFYATIILALLFSIYIYLNN